jgi:hypothetical protein
MMERDLIILKSVLDVVEEVIDGRLKRRVNTVSWLLKVPISPFFVAHINICGVILTKERFIVSWKIPTG